MAMSFGRTLINSLINPGYGQGLFTAGQAAGQQLGGHNQQVNERVDQQQQARESIMTMLTQADVSDPRVAQSAIAVARQTNVPMEEVDALLKDARQESRAQESAKRARQSHQFRIAAAQEEALKRQQAQERAQVTQRIEAAIGNENAIERVIAAAPPEHQQFAREYVEKYRSYQDDMTERREKAQTKEPIDDETLAQYARILPEEVIDAYKTSVDKAQGTNAAGAVIAQQNKLLLDAYAAASRAKAARESDEESRKVVKDPPDRVKEVAEGYMGTVDWDSAHANAGVERRPWYFGGINNDLEDEVQRQIAVAIHTNADVVMTPERATDIAARVLQEWHGNVKETAGEPDETDASAEEEVSNKPWERY